MPTPQPRPRYKAPALSAVPSFQCECGTIHHAADGKLPVGWTQSAGAVFCIDCTRAGNAHRQLKQPDGRSDRVRLRGEVMALLVEGQRLMPRGTKARADWTSRVSTLLSDVRRSAV